MPPAKELAIVCLASKAELAVCGAMHPERRRFAIGYHLIG